MPALPVGVRLAVVDARLDDAIRPIAETDFHNLAGLDRGDGVGALHDERAADVVAVDVGAEVNGADRVSVRVGWRHHLARVPKRDSDAAHVRDHVGAQHVVRMAQFAVGFAAGVVVGEHTRPRQACWHDQRAVCAATRLGRVQSDAVVADGLCRHGVLGWPNARTGAGVHRHWIGAPGCPSGGGVDHKIV